MAATAGPAALPKEALAPRPTTQNENQIFREYYSETDQFSSTEGILKILAAILCVASSALLLRGGSCAGAGTLVVSSATLALACGAVLALLYAAVACRLPLYAPQAWLFGDIIVSTVMGVLLLLSAVLSATLCDASGPADYALAPLAVLNAGLVIASAVITYASVMRRWDAASGPAVEPRHPPPTELDV